MAIIFQGVEIDRDYKGNLRGHLRIKGDYGRTTLNLTEDLCAKIMHACADNIVEAAENTATEFRREALQLESEAVASIDHSE